MELSSNILTMFGMGGGIVIFVVSSFATIKYVDEKHDAVKSSIQDNLVDIRDRLARIEELLMRK